MKGDFNLNEDFNTSYDNQDMNYGNSYDQNINNNIGNVYDQNQGINYNNNNMNNLYDQNQNMSYGSDASGFDTNSDFIDDSSVVYDENNKSKKFNIFEKIDKATLTIIGVLVSVVIVIVIIISLVIAGNNRTYKSSIVIPDIIYMGESSNISVKSVGKKDVSKTKVKFSSSNKHVADVLDEELVGNNLNNHIIPIGEGKTTISVDATFGNKNMGSLKKDVVVCPSFDKSLFYGKSVSIVEGRENELNIDFGSSKCKEGITYKSGDDKIFTVNNKGEISGIKKGSTTLTISKGNRSFTLPVYVTSSYVAMNSLNTSSKVQLMPGDSMRLKYDVMPSNASIQTLYYSVSNDEVISVSDTGLIKALSEGSTTLRIYDGERMTEEEVNVVVYTNKDGDSHANELVLDEKEVVLKQGNSIRINPVVLPDEVSDKSLSYISSNNEVATVKNNVIYGKNPGSVIVTFFTKEKVYKNIKVTVEEIKEPSIVISDKVRSGNWHKKAYTFGVLNNDSVSKIYINNKEMDKLLIKEDEDKVYNVKSCIDDICSKEVSYNSRLDLTKPSVLKVINESGKLYIALLDETSLIKDWCITTYNNYNKCIWRSSKNIKSPVVNFNVSDNRTYYIFARDNAGNISDAYKFN